MAQRLLGADEAEAQGRMLIRPEEATQCGGVYESLGFDRHDKIAFVAGPEDQTRSHQARRR